LSTYNPIIHLYLSFLLVNVCPRRRLALWRKKNDLVFFISFFYIYFVFLFIK